VRLRPGEREALERWAREASGKRTTPRGGVSKAIRTLIRERLERERAQALTDRTPANDSVRPAA